MKFYCIIRASQVNGYLTGFLIGVQLLCTFLDIEGNICDCSACQTASGHAY